MGFQINIPEMKKKTEIEDKILFKINNDLQECVNDIEYVKNNFTPVKTEIKTTSIDYDKNKYYKPTDNKILETTNYTELELKLFQHANIIYSIFQCFYSKRKNYMGMNLTGLVQGKMETGLGFRSSIIKSSITNAVNDELKKIIHQFFMEETNFNNINIYKINSNSFKWQDFYSEQIKFNYIYLIANLHSKEYFFILGK